jgi:hypothetical protein
MKKLTPIKLDDLKAEQVRQEHHDLLTDVSARAIVGTVHVQNVSLANGVVTPVPHTLGRIPKMVKFSAPRGAAAAGYITEVRNAATDRSKFVNLQANGFGATIVLDIEVT